MAAAPFGAAPVISDGQYTSTLYGWIRDGKYADVELVLRAKLRESPKSRAALSLLGYVLYNQGPEASWAALAPSWAWGNPAPSSELELELALRP